MNLFKRATASVALVSLVSGLFVTGVSAYSPAELEAANALAAKNVINAKSDAAGYNLDANVLRQEIFKVGAGVAGLSANTSCEDKFGDISATNPNDWACGYAEALLAKGMLSANANARPTDNISKAEAVKLMLETAGHTEIFSDVNKWQEQVVAYAAAKGVVASFSDYGTAATRGFVFGAANNAMAEEEVTDEIDLEKLLGLDDEDEEETNEGTDEGTDEETTTTVSGNGDLEVSLSASTPASATVPGGVNGLPVAKFDFTAGSEDVTVTQITVKRRGLSDNDTISSLAVFTDEGRASNEKNDNQENDTEAQLNLSDGGVVVKAGETRTLTIVADLGSAEDNPTTTTVNENVAANDEFALEIVNVIANATVEMDGSVVSNTLRIGSVNAPSIEFTAGSSVSDPKLGEEGADIFEFEIEGANDEDVIIHSITFEGSSDAEDDLRNFELVYNNKVIASTTYMTDDYLTFNIEGGLKIEEDKTEDFTVTADVVEGATDTISFSIDEPLDVTAESTKFGYGAAIVIGDTNFGTLTIEAGELTITEIEADFDEIREDKDNVVLGQIKVTNVAGQNLELQEFGVKIVLDNGGTSKLPGSATNLTVAELFDDVELYNETTGSSYELTAGTVTTSGDETTAIFSEDNIDVILEQGTTTWAIRADTADEVDDFDSSSFTISFATGNDTASTEGSFYVEETEDDEEVTDITPSSLSFNTIDGAESGAKASLVPLSTTIEVVRGADEVVALQFELEAEESSDVIIEDVVATVTAATNAFGTNNKPNQSITEAKLYLGSVSDANLLDQESGSNIADDGTISFDDFDFVTIDANETQEFVITLSIVDASSAVANGNLQVSLKSIDAEDDDNDDVTVSGLTSALVSARSIVVNNTGEIVTLAFDDANEDNEFNKLALAGDDSIIASYDVRADNEEVDVETVVFTLDDSVVGGGVVDLKSTVVSASLLLDGVVIETNTNADIDNAAGTITFDDMNDLIIPESTTELALRLNTANIGEDFVGVAQTGLVVTNVVFSDAEGADSGKDISSGDIVTYDISDVSKTLDIVTAVVTPSIVSTFGTDDQTAEVRLTVDAGDNTDSTGDAVQADLVSLTFDVSSISNTDGVISVFNSNGTLVGTSAVVATAGNISVALTDDGQEGSTAQNDSIGNDNETYRIETTVEGIIRLAKDGVTYTVDGSNNNSTKLENTLEIGQYADSN